MALGLGVDVAEGELPATDPPHAASASAHKTLVRSSLEFTRTRTAVGYAGRVPSDSGVLISITSLNTWTPANASYSATARSGAGTSVIFT